MGLILLLSKYLFVVLLLFCAILVNVSNIVYLIILSGVLLVVFVTTILMGSLTNNLVPFTFLTLSMNGGSVFIMMIVVVVFL